MKVFKYSLIGLLITIVVFTITYFVGPKIQAPIFPDSLPEIPADILTIENWINENERNIKDIKPNNQAQIVWYDENSIPQITL